MKLTTALLFLLLVSLIGCGGTAASPGSGSGSGTGSGSGSGSGSGTSNTPAPTGSATTPVSSPAVVSVAAGQTVGSIDIALSSPQSSPAPNAEDLGVAAMSGTASAYNTGDVIHRGQTARVLLFGSGLSGDMQVVIRGPADITISGITSIKSTNNTPGLSFIAAASANAALGARTVVLQTANGDITTFTGGLEVQP